MEETAYGLRAELNIPYEKAVEKATAALKEEGVPNIHLESELQTTSLAQIRIRLEAFLEMIGGN